MAGFIYTYRTSDGVRHVGEIDAPSRDEAFIELRKNGIRPIKVTAKDGTKANGASVGGRGRGTLLFVAACLLVGGLGAAYAVWHSAHSASTSADDVLKQAPQGPIAFTTATALARQPILGSRLRIENCPTNLFKHAAEAALAKFAEPGRPVPSDLVLPEEAAFRAALADTIRIYSNELTEYIDLKRIVVGMKSELRAYLDGGGTFDEYVTELYKRQKTEEAYRQKAEAHLAELIGEPKLSREQQAAAYAYWLKANASLKAMGIYEVPLPDPLRAYQLSAGLDE